MIRFVVGGCSAVRFQNDVSQFVSHNLDFKNSSGMVSILQFYLSNVETLILGFHIDDVHCSFKPVLGWSFLYVLSAVMNENLLFADHVEPGYSLHWRTVVELESHGDGVVHESLDNSWDFFRL